MKQNPKEVINIITLVDHFIARINTQCIEHKIDKIYDVKIISGKIQGKEKGEKIYRRVQVTMAISKTRERIVLFSTDYVFNNSADILKVDYKRKLYKEVLYNCFGTALFTLENVVKQNKINKSLKNAVNITKLHAEHPVTAEDAYKSSTKE